MNNNLVSIIVPVYNVENYLDKCIKSIVNQTYKNLEIILVDDGSPDNCPQICDNWKELDSRIKVIHKENGGLSSARNAGLDICSGEYVAFVDSDDFVELDYIDKMLTQAQISKSDLIICGFKTIFQDKKKHIKTDLKNEIINNDNKFDILFRKNNVAIVVAWNKLYKKEIFENLRYTKNKIHEDEFIICNILNNTKSCICLMQDCLYNYIIRDGSITNSKKDSRAFDKIEALHYRLSLFPLGSYYFSEVVAQLFHTYLLIDLNLKNEYKKELKVNFNQDFKKYFKYLNLKRKLKYFLYKYFKINLLKLKHH